MGRIGTDPYEFLRITSSTLPSTLYDLHYLILCFDSRNSILTHSRIDERTMNRDLVQGFFTSSMLCINDYHVGNDIPTSPPCEAQIMCCLKDIVFPSGLVERHGLGFF